MSRLARLPAFLRRLVCRRRSRSRLADMARVRVFTRMGDQDPVAMVGYIPRPLLEEIRSRVRAAAVSEGREVCLVAIPRAAQKVRVVLPTLSLDEAHPAWRISLGVAVHSEVPTQATAEPAEVAAKPETTRITVELAGLLNEAQQVAAAAAEKALVAG